MDKEKPHCSDFIVAAVRNLRRNPANLSAGCNAGMSLKRLWKVASEIFSEKEFRQGLEKLLGEDVILIIARHHFGRNSSEVTVTKIPNDIGDCHCWYLNDKEEYVSAPNPDEAGDHFLWKILVYIQADGLPQKAERVKGSTCKRAVAQTIVESMD